MAHGKILGVDGDLTTPAGAPAGPVRWGVLLPTFDPLDVGTPPVVEAARLAEELGFDAAWAGDHLACPAPVLDSLCALSAAAAVTGRIELGVSVLQLALRHPAWAAKQLATIDALAPGRLRLGVGAGGEYADEYAAAGVAVQTRGRRLDEILGVLPALLRGEPVSHAGPHAPVTVPGLRPAVSAVPRVSVGGRREASMRRAARFGDQWLPMWLDPGAIRAARRRLADLAAEHGRPAPSVGLLVLADIDDDPAKARSRCEEMTAGQYRMPFRVVDKWTAYGPAGHVAQMLRDYREAGVSEFILMPTPHAPLVQYERLAELRDLVGR